MASGQQHVIESRDYGPRRTTRKRPAYTESEHSTHYFWAFARDFDKSNAHLTEKIVEVVGAAFSREDKPMIEAAQRNLDRYAAKLLNFTVGDSGSAQVRKELERLAALEASESP